MLPIAKRFLKEEFKETLRLQTVEGISLRRLNQMHESTVKDIRNNLNNDHYKDNKLTYEGLKKFKADNIKCYFYSRDISIEDSSNKQIKVQSVKELIKIIDKYYDEKKYFINISYMSKPEPCIDVRLLSKQPPVVFSQSWKDDLKIIKERGLMKNLLRCQLEANVPIRSIAIYAVQNEYSVEDFIRVRTQRGIYKHIDEKIVKYIATNNASIDVYQIDINDENYDMWDRGECDNAEEFLQVLNDLPDSYYSKNITYHKEFSYEHKCYRRRIHASVCNKTMYIYPSELETKEEFKDFTWSHGLNAYNSDDIICNALNILNNKDMEICCTSYCFPIGTVGFYVQGDCKIFAVNDVGSWIKRDEKGNSRRVIEVSHIYDEIKRPEDIPDYYMTKNGKHSLPFYGGESIVTNLKITGIWAKRQYDKEFKKRTEETVNDLKKITGINKVDYI